MADVIISNTQAAATKMDYIAAMVQKELKEKAILSGYFTDVSQWAVKGNKSISFPKLTSFTVGERGSGVTLDAQALTATVDKLDLDIPAYIKWIIDTNDSVQSTIEWEVETVLRAASAHGRYVDQKLIEEALAARFEVSVAGDITRDNVLEMREYVRKNNGDLSQCALFVAVDQMTALLKIDEFSKADVFGQAVIPNGVIGRLYGIPVVEHNLLADGEYFMAEKSALAFGFQRAPAYGEEPAIDYGVGAVKRVMDALYGVKALQIGQALAAPTKSALIAGYKA